MTDEQRARAIADTIIRDVAELHDRTSPKYDDDILLVTADELRLIVMHPLAEALSSVRAEEREKKQPVYLLSEWHEDIGDVLWWKFPVKESPYVGSPLDVGHTVEITVRAHGVDKVMRVNIGGWPGYHTHWTPIIIPAIRETDSDA